MTENKRHMLRPLYNLHPLRILIGFIRTRFSVAICTGGMYALWAKDSGRDKDPLRRLGGVAYIMLFEGVRSIMYRVKGEKLDTLT
jgi:hypothetical protein